MTADYSQWRRWLRGEDTRNYVRGLHPGFYRARYGAKNDWFPLAIFEHDGELCGLLLGDVYNALELEALFLWPQAARHPISETLYREVAEQGQPWPPKPPRSKPNGQ